MKLEHAAALALVGLLAYTLGKKAAASVATAPQNYNAVTTQNEWWTYAGSWGQ